MGLTTAVVWLCIAAIVPDTVTCRRQQTSAWSNSQLMTLQKPGNCKEHTSYPNTIQCALTRRCIAYPQDFMNGRCDCCGPDKNCSTCADHSDEDRYSLLNPTSCQHRTAYPYGSTFQCAGNRSICLSLHQHRLNGRCDCCPDQNYDCSHPNCTDHSDEECLPYNWGSQFSCDGRCYGMEKYADNVTDCFKDCTIEGNEVARNGCLTRKAQTASTPLVSPPTDQQGRASGSITGQKSGSNHSAAESDDDVTMWDCYLPPAAGVCPEQEQRAAESPRFYWYYDIQRQECLVFTYYGCGGNQNRFKSKIECIRRCARIDGPICALNLPAISGQIAHPSLADRSCANWRCPDGYRCKRGGLYSSIGCCSIEIERLYSDAHTGSALCRNVAPLTVRGDIIVSASCAMLQCPQNYECRRNALFANCCPSIFRGRSSTARFKRVTAHSSNAPGSSGVNPPWLTSRKFQGDIAGFENQSDFDQYVRKINEYQRQKHAKRSNGAFNSAINDPRGLWPDARVPYIIDSTDESLKRVVDQAISDFHRLTCVRFVTRTTERNYLRIISSDVGCYSYLGNRRTGAQVVSLSSESCKTKGTVLHEFMHAIGFWHEHQRTDRDYFVNVIEENATPDCRENNLAKAGLNQMWLIGHYDIDSVMHYPPTACAKGVESTITLKNSNRRDFGDANGFSPEDVRKINILYSCRGGNQVTTATSTNTICPSYVTSHYQGSDGGRYAMCAAVYESPNCGNAWWKLPGNWESNDLSAHEMLAKNNWNWDDEIASLEVNPGCTITLCQEKNYGGVCRTYEGGSTGVNIPSIDSLERDVSSLKCSCNQCPTFPLSYVDQRNANEYPTCGVIYENKFCGGAKFSFSIVTRTLSYISKSSGGTWHNQVQSAQVRKGCKLWLCSEASLGGTCSPFEATNEHENVNSIGHSVASLACTCNSGADNGQWSGVTRGDSPSEFIPTGWGSNTGRRTCAVAIQMFHPKGWGMWIPDGERVMERSIVNVPAYSYLVTRPGCTLHYHTGDNFTGEHAEIPPNSHRPTPNGYGLYGMWSYECTCREWD